MYVGVCWGMSGFRIVVGELGGDGEQECTRGDTLLEVAEVYNHPSGYLSDYIVGCVRFREARPLLCILAYHK
jgi:hypothetical protein